MNEQQNILSRKVRFNILDAVIVLLVVLCIVGICFRYSIMDSLGLGQEMAEYTVEFCVSGMDSTLPDFLGEGNALYFADAGKAGVLCGVSEFSNMTAISAGSPALIIKPHTVYVDDGNGAVVSAAYPDNKLVDAEGAFRCNGAYSDDGRFSVEGKSFITIGQTVTLYTDTVTLNVTVTDISPISH